MNHFIVTDKSSIGGTLVIYDYVLNETDKDVVYDVSFNVLAVTTDVRPLLCDTILTELAHLWYIKWQIVYRIHFIKTVVDGDSVYEIQVIKDAIFHRCCHTLLTDDDTEQLIDESYDKILGNISVTCDGNGWTVDTVLWMSNLLVSINL